MVIIVLLFPKWPLPWGCKFIPPCTKSNYDSGRVERYAMELSSCSATSREMKCLLFGRSTWGCFVIRPDCICRNMTHLGLLYCWTWNWLQKDPSTVTHRGPQQCLSDRAQRWQLLCFWAGFSRVSEVDGHFFPSRKVRHPVFPPALFFCLFPCLGKRFSLFLVIWHWAVMVREKFTLLLSSSFRLV